MTYVYRISSPQDKKTVVYALSWLGVREAKKTAMQNGYRINVLKLKLCQVPKNEMELVKCLAR